MTKYETTILYLNKSDKENHVFIFNDKEETLGSKVESLLLNISDVRDVLENPPKDAKGKRRFAKVSVMYKKD